MSLGVRAGSATLLLLMVVTSACRFERRPEAVGDEPVTDVPYASPEGPTSPIEDSVRATVVEVIRAFDLGDGARVAELTTPDAVLIDQEGSVRWTPDAGGPLPRALAEGDGELGRTEGSTFSVLSEGAVLYSCRFLAQAAAEETPRSVVESWVLVRTGAGWRVRYLHRSLRQDPRPPLS